MKDRLLESPSVNVFSQTDRNEDTNVLFIFFTRDERVCKPVIVSQFYSIYWAIATGGMVDLWTPVRSQTFGAKKFFKPPVKILLAPFAHLVELTLKRLRLGGEFRRQGEH